MVFSHLKKSVKLTEPGLSVGLGERGSKVDVLSDLVSALQGWWVRVSQIHIRL